MSFVLGVNLLRKVYLFSDTRLIRESPSGIKIVNDNFLKAVALNERVASVAAGNALLASFFLSRIKNKLSQADNYEKTIRTIRRLGKELVIEFLNRTTLNNKRVGIIIGGFNNHRGKSINAGLLGQIMSAPFRGVPSGNVQQSVDPEIISALAKSIPRDRELPGTALINTNVLNSEMHTIILSTYLNEQPIEIEEVGCFEHALFHPNSLSKPETIPPALLSALEFRTNKPAEMYDLIYEDSELLINHINQVSEKRNFVEVGQLIFPQMVTLNGIIFPTGTIARRNLQGKVEILGGITIEGQKYIYTSGTGDKSEFEQLEFFFDKHNPDLNSNPELASMEI